MFEKGKLQFQSLEPGIDTLKQQGHGVKTAMSAENLQRHEIWKRLEQGRLAKANNGGYVGYGSPAFGQQSINGELVENPEECQIIELIRRHHKSGKSLQKIADWLNQQGYRTKRGQVWRRISVKRVLDRLYGKTPRTQGVNFQALHSSKVTDSLSREDNSLNH